MNLRDINRDFSQNFFKVRTIEMHTGGEPLRIPVEGIPPLPGNSILELRRFVVKLR